MLNLPLQHRGQKEEFAFLKVCLEICFMYGTNVHNQLIWDICFFWYRINIWLIWKCIHLKGIFNEHILLDLFLHHMNYMCSHILNAQNYLDTVLHILTIRGGKEIFSLKL